MQLAQGTLFSEDILLEELSVRDFKYNGKRDDSADSTV